MIGLEVKEPNAQDFEPVDLFTDQPIGAPDAYPKYDKTGSQYARYSWLQLPNSGAYVDDTFE